MRRTVMLPILSAVLLAACATLPPPLSVDDVIALSKQGTTPNALIAMIRDSRTSYRLSASDIVRLNKAGVAEPVLDYMQQTQLDDVRQEERMRQWDYGPRFGFGWWRRW
ncbi:hypothetical protein [Chitinimonas koreensis]|uniref:hypothetical protein n=1 Tax=Chitinimonas koreensis TaxID=356302 RepID=UPI000406BC70|nr:hypothetical protein [Chitinimonas koreensis]QNM95249.1 hypothetical protein H9L41_15365 [Chitinimonas koreensis]